MLLVYFALEYWLFAALAAGAFHYIFHISRAGSILGAGLEPKIVERCYTLAHGRCREVGTKEIRAGMTIGEWE